jgi:hypothetical protein
LALPDLPWKIARVRVLPLVFARWTPPYMVVSTGIPEEPLFFDLLGYIEPIRCGDVELMQLGRQIMIFGMNH